MPAPVSFNHHRARSATPVNDSPLPRGAASCLDGATTSDVGTRTCRHGSASPHAPCSNTWLGLLGQETRCGATGVPKSESLPSASIHFQTSSAFFTPARRPDHLPLGLHLSHACGEVCVCPSHECSAHTLPRHAATMSAPDAENATTVCHTPGRGHRPAVALVAPMQSPSACTVNPPTPQPNCGFEDIAHG